MKKAAGYHPGPVTPSTADRVPSAFSVTRVSLHLNQLLSPDLDNRETSRKSRLEMTFCWNEMKTKKSCSSRSKRNIFRDFGVERKKYFLPCAKIILFLFQRKFESVVRICKTVGLSISIFELFDRNQQEGGIAQIALKIYLPPVRFSVFPSRHSSSDASWSVDSGNWWNPSSS